MTDAGALRAVAQPALVAEPTLELIPALSARSRAARHHGRRDRSDA